MDKGNIYKSLEDLTKFLRGKNTTTTEIYDCFEKLSNLDIYFPQKEVFLFELIQDRWNDQKRKDFKLNAHIWEIFNKVWCQFNDELLLKKLFKNLKFTQLLLQTLSLFNETEVDENTKLFILQLSKTISLINSTSTIEISFDNSCKILASILALLYKLPIEMISDKERSNLINALMITLDFQNISEINYKMSNTYCNDLLLATIQYISKFDFNLENELSNLLVKYLGQFIFNAENSNNNNNIDSLKVLERFFKNNSDKLKNDDNVIILLYKISISFLSRNNFKQLETIFTFIINCQPNVTAILLKELSSSKKTMSQEFLESLFNKTLESSKSDASKFEDLEFWSLISHILNLDVEIGIKYTTTLMDLLINHKSNHEKFVQDIWTKIINCHVNARELTLFLTKWQDYSKEYFVENKKSCPFLTETIFTEQIANNLHSLSTTQLKDILTDMVDIVTTETIEDDNVTLLAFKVCLRSLPKLSYTILVDLKPILAKIFEINLETFSKLWEVKHLIMEGYDDLVPMEQINEIANGQLENILAKNQLSNELFYYFFKLREYKIFEFDTIEEKLVTYLSEIKDIEARNDFLYTILKNWYSIINSSFNKKNIIILMKTLLEEENINLLSRLFEDDNFFEEQNVMFNLVNEMITSFENDTIISYLLRIPIQCINKNNRIQLIDSIIKKKQVSGNDYKLVTNLLEYPTYKSTIESDFKNMKEMVTKDEKSISIFEKVWENYLNDIKDVNHSKFVDTTINEVLNELNNGVFEIAIVQISLSIVKLSPIEISTKLKNEFVELCLNKISSIEDSTDKLLPWLLTGLHDVSTVFINDNELTDSIRAIISSSMKKFQSQFTKLNTTLLTSLFVLYTDVFNDKLEYLYAQYMVVRIYGASKEIVLPVVEKILKDRLETNVDEFNEGFIMTIKSLISNETHEFDESILELYELQIKNIKKDNVIGSHLFAKSIAILHDNIHNFVHVKSSIISLLKALQDLQISKPWIFNQYCTELLFPLCLNINISFINDDASVSNDEIFKQSIKLISNVMLVHRVKLSNRHHLVVSLLCSLLEIISRSNSCNLTKKSAKLLSRLIINYCEPTNVNGGQNINGRKLNSRITLIKQSLRKHVPVLVVKFVHVSINQPFEVNIRKELIPALYSTFDLLSQNELSTVSSILDVSGKQYFKSLYSEYKKTGKWRED